VQRIIFIFILLITYEVGLFAQSIGFTYQGIAIDQNQLPIKSKKISLKVSIISGSTQGIVSYAETHAPITDDYGHFSVNVGTGTKITGSINTLQWDRVSYYLKVEADIAGGTSFSLVGISQMYPVPYTISANSAGSTLIKLDTLKENLSQLKLSKRNDSLVINNTNSGIYIQTVDSLLKLIDQVKNLQTRKLNYDSIINVLNRKIDSISSLIAWQNTSSIKSALIQNSIELNSKNLDSVLMPSVYFDGEKTHVQIGAIKLGSLISAKNFTIEAWVKSLQRSDVRQTIFTSGFDGSGWVDYQVSLLGGKIILQTRNSSGLVISADFPNDSLWHHIVFTNIENKSSAIFIDGVEKIRQNNMGLGIVSSPNVTIGALFSTINNYKFETFFKGNLRKLRVSKGVVYTTEFNPSYKYVKSDSTLAFWELNEGSGTTITCSDTLYNGILYNGSWQTFDTLKNLKIGDRFAGGIVAYIFQPGDSAYVSGQVNGIIAAEEDQTKNSTSTYFKGTGVQWQDASYSVTPPYFDSTGAIGTKLGIGNANTKKIISTPQIRAREFLAAKVAVDYRGGEYSDWFLPSRDELEKLFLNKNQIDGFDTSWYWSSSEKDIGYAYALNFKDGIIQTGYKGPGSTPYKVRAIRYINPINLKEEVSSNISNGLIAYYPFNGNANDSSGNGNNGIVSGAILTPDRNGSASSAYLFNGSNSFIDIPNKFFNNGWDSSTVSLWFNPDKHASSTANGPGQTFFNTNPHRGEGVGYSYNGSKKIYHYKSSDGINWDLLSNKEFNYSNVTLNDWYHLVIVKSNLIYNYYINGVLVDSFSVSKKPAKDLYSLRIGAITCCSPETFSGKLDDFRFYNRALSNSEVINLYNSEKPTPPSTPTIGTITQPTCTLSTGSVALSGLPQTGTWTVTATGGSTKSGTGSTTSFTGLSAGTYTFTVTNSEGLTSSASSSAIINAQPASPSAPVVGTVTQPTTTVSTGSVALSGLPQTGTWTVTATGGSTKSGTGSTTTFTGLSAGTYTFTVTNANGCTSAATASSTTINAAPTTLTSGLVAYYPFNGNANDTSGNANNGLVTRAALTTDRFGTANTAYSFDGSSTSIKIPFSSSINSIQKGLTISAWIYMQGGTPAGNPPRLLELRGAYGNGGNAGFVLLSQGNSDSARTFETRWYNNNGATNISIAPTSSVTSKDWHHVVFTADGESAVGKFYVDGILRGTNAQMQNQGKITSCDYNSNAIFIGIEPGGTGAWGGKIDELRIYNRALDSNEVLYAFNAQNNTEPSNLKVGDSYGGGIIAYLLQPGDSGYSATVPHGIIVPPTDQGRLIYPWGCSGTLIGEISTSWGAGKTNTNKILAKCTATNTAAKLCDDLVLNGYTDWFLPSLGDLQKIRNLHQSGKGSFSTDLSYFTSSEVNADLTYEYYISSGATGQVAKTLNLCVRAARYF
jgi:hypothetical protein